MKKMKTQTLVMSSLLMAMHIVLSFFSITLSTTILWIIPHAVRGLIVGLWAKSRNYRMGKVETTIVIVVSSVVATVLNTIGMYIDGIVWGYEAAAFASIGIRLVNSVVTSIIFVIIVIPLMKPLRKYFHIGEK